MTPFKISLKNIKKSFKDYAIYFFTLILGVAIFYVFNAIDSQTVLMNVTSSTREIIKLMTSMLSGVSVFVAFILGFLIIYASRFLMKRRHKEFGIYLTLGMSKRKISMILFFETMIIGLISLIVGLILGAGLSQLMSILVANMFEADMTNYEFIFSTDACLKTLIYFGIMYLIVMIFNTINVSRCKLIDLLDASKKSEKIKLKNPIICTTVFIAAAITLGYAYYLVTAGIDELTDELTEANGILLPLALGSISTFFIFWSLSGLILRIVTNMKNVYYKGLNSFTLRQVSSKINTTVFSMTIICLMLFFTICILSAALSMKNSMTQNLQTLAPADIELYKTRNMPIDYGLNNGYTEEQVKDTYSTVEETLTNLNFDYQKYFKDITKVNIYATNDITFRTTLGNQLEEVQKEFPLIDLDSAEALVKISEYNKVAKLYNQPEYTLKDNEYMIIADFDSMIDIRNRALKSGVTIDLNGKTYNPKYVECQDGFIEMSSNHINTGIILVPDNAVDESMLEEEHLIANYKANDDEGKQKIENMIMDLGNEPNADAYELDASTKISIYEASVGLGALVTFIGLYLGLIFLMSSAAILALKELTESTDNQNRFNMLRKLGADEKMINKALFRQILIFFLFPLVLAIIHSIFGIMFCNYILSTFGSEELLPSIIMTSIFIVIIYGGYFLITYLCSKNIIKEKTN